MPQQVYVYQKLKGIFYPVSSSTSVSIEPVRFDITMATAGTVGGRACFHMATNVALGGWSNALKGHVEYGSSGRTTGLGSAICAEIALSAGTTSGTYAPLESEVVIGSGAKQGTATSFLYMNATGDDVANFDTSGYLFEIGSGITAGDGKLYDTTVTAATGDATLRIRIGGATKYLLVANDAS